MPAPARRAFAVHLQGDDSARHLRKVDGVSFEDAALTFVEERHLDSEGGAVSVIVQDADNGREQCFRVDVHTGRTDPCA